MRSSPDGEERGSEGLASVCCVLKMRVTLGFVAILDSMVMGEPPVSARAALQFWMYRSTLASGDAVVVGLSQHS